VLQRDKYFSLIDEGIELLTDFESELHFHWPGSKEAAYLRDLVLWLKARCKDQDVRTDTLNEQLTTLAVYLEDIQSQLLFLIEKRPFSRTYCYND